jgi:hypothetical protein
VQFHYSRVPLASAEPRQEMETRRKLYAAITCEEDFGTVLDINRTLPGMVGTDFLFGRNESGNQNLHRWVDKLLGVRV